MPGNTRWTSNLDMVNCFLKSKAEILNVVREKKPDLIAEVEKLYVDYESVYEAYRKLVTPIQKRIADLEVSTLF